MPRQPPPLVNDRLLSLVAGGGARRAVGGAQHASVRGSSDDLVARMERGWVPVEPGSLVIPRPVDDRAEQESEASDRPMGGHRQAPPAPGRHRDPLGRRGPSVVTLPVSLRGARVDVSWLGIVAVVVVLAAAALLFAVRVARADAGVAPEPVAASAPLGVARSSTPAAFVSAGVSGPAPAAASSPTTMKVHVVGQVAHPGVVTLPVGSRIQDAVSRAGGPVPGADVARLNLAQFLTDGEQVYVPRPGEDPPAPIGGAAGAAVGAVGSGGVGAVAAPVDLNSADLASLDTLPGVGPVLAQRILDWRGQHRFSTVDELGEVSGIGDKLLVQLRPLVTV